MSSLQFYLGVQGDKSPDTYIHLARKAEHYDFDRIYVYDDLLYYPAYPVLVTMAQHTRRIGLGACLLNGFYRHPAIVASNYAYLYRMIGPRAIMGLGRGAFFDLLGMPTSEAHTRKGFEETLGMIRHLLFGAREPFTGELFRASEKAFLKVPVPSEPRLLTATWNTDMALLAGKYGTALQIAEVWNLNYMQELYAAYVQGLKESLLPMEPEFSIGGMVCVGNSEREALEKARRTVAVYLPYLQTILRKDGIDPDSELVRRIAAHSKAGEMDKAANLIPDHMVKALSLVGTPEQIAHRINALRKDVPIRGILFSPPYGTHDSILKNIKFLKKELIDKFLQ